MVSVETVVCTYGFDLELGLVGTWFRGRFYLGTFELDERGCVSRTDFPNGGLVAVWNAL